jgi:phosphoribosylformylglycinamidine cyclo-ligase
MALLRSEIRVNGLAHITGGGLTNLLRIGRGVGYEISSPLPVPAVFELVAERGGVGAAEMWEVFNMGCGFCVIVPPGDAQAAVELLAAHHPGTGVIGRLTDVAGVVRVPELGIEGTPAGLGGA